MVGDLGWIILDGFAVRPVEGGLGGFGLMLAWWAWSWKWPQRTAPETNSPFFWRNPFQYPSTHFQTDTQHTWSSRDWHYTIFPSSPDTSQAVRAPQTPFPNCASTSKSPPRLKSQSKGSRMFCGFFSPWPAACTLSRCSWSSTRWGRREELVSIRGRERKVGVAFGWVIGEYRGLGVW